MSEGNAAPMPQYQSIKKVWALEIEQAEMVSVNRSVNPNGQMLRLRFVDYIYAPKDVDQSVVTRYFPQPGDFFVVYEDGYQSISPRKAFVEGYVKI